MFGIHDDACDKIDKYKKQISKLKKDLKEKNIQIEEMRETLKTVIDKAIPIMPTGYQERIGNAAIVIPLLNKYWPEKK